MENQNEQKNEQQNQQQNQQEQVNQYSQYKELQELNKKEEASKRSFIGGLTTGLLIAVCITCGAYIITNLNVKKPKDASSLKPSQTEQAEQGESESAITESVIQKMKVIESVIDQYYYHEDTDKQLMEDDIYKGMIASLGDPYSTYYSDTELEELMQQTEGIYYGIGAYVSLDIVSGYSKISGVIEGTPAEAAGLRDGDIIYMVNQESLEGLDTTEVVAKIKGEEGTIVHLTLVREGETEYVEVDVERKKIISPTVKYEMKEDSVGYIQITEFDDVTLDQFVEAKAVLEEQGMKGLVLDLRSNPGGNLITAVEIASRILPKGLIVYTEDRNGNRKEYDCDGTRQLEIPLVVLVNGYSASASEIVAGAIKDYGIGTLVGTTTYGKGIVQQVIGLDDRSAVKLTISNYYTPKGVNIHEIGIEPDVVCEFDSEAYYNEENQVDNQLDKAIEVLQEQMSGE